jgi:tRNA (guanine26-N2/guanine27-N2)-dimethyltransferase
MRVIEGKAVVEASHQKIVTRDMGVFYNPQMKLNRDLSVLLLKATKKRKMRIADPLAASGIRSIRFLKELPSQIERIFINDASPSAVRNIKKNMKANKLGKSNKAQVSQQEASKFLLNNKPFDYVDIDPFGTPTPFMDAAVKSLRKGSILAVTATDTAALCGSAPKACLRKYWATPLRNYFMHETGLRILIRRAQLIGASQQKALIPLFSYAWQHYMRVFFICTTRNTDVDNILKQHRMISFCTSCLVTGVGTATAVLKKCKCSKELIAGPLWTGQLWDQKLLSSLAKESNEHAAFLNLLKGEAAINAPFFYDTHFFSKKLSIRQVPKRDAIIARIKKAGYKASRTHFSREGIRTTMPHQKFVKFLKK